MSLHHNLNRNHYNHSRNEIHDHHRHKCRTRILAISLMETRWEAGIHEFDELDECTYWEAGVGEHNKVDADTYWELLCDHVLGHRDEDRE